MFEATAKGLFKDAPRTIILTSEEAEQRRQAHRERMKRLEGR